MAPRQSAAIPSYKRISFGRGIVNSARFTPEGNAVVYSALWNDSPEELFFVRLDQPEARALGVKLSSVFGVGRRRNGLNPAACRNRL
jgi:hypothetical protein